MKIAWHRCWILLVVEMTSRICVAAVDVQIPVNIIASRTTEIRTISGVVQLPLDISLDWSKPQPGVTRAVILLHGKGRDVDGDYRGLERAARKAGAIGAESLLIAPQFLNELDAIEHGLPNEIVRWQAGTWEAGEAAVAPVPVSAYELLDALFLRLSDRQTFPDLHDIVLAGHSAGGQAVQRYAIVGTAAIQLVAKGIHVRYVIANSSSYLYFNDERPGPHGFECRNWNRWRYGTHEAPTYVKLSKKHGWPELEDEYAKADVIYLLGDEDVDPQQKDLDISCAGEAQGSTRLARGQAYFAYLKARHPAGWGQRLWIVGGVAHSATKMVEAPCGVKALFATGVCKDE
jgi:pimeloyl-ACP methyl ester carboxylesterase